MSEQSGGENRAASALAGLDLLIADPRGAVAKAVAHDLATTGGARTALVSSGRDALTLLRDSPVDGVLCSTTLEDIDPWRFAGMIRSGRFTAPDLPVITLCDDATDPTTRMLADERNVVLAGPSTPTALTRAVAAAIRRRKKESLLIIEDDPTAAHSARLAVEKDFAVEVCGDGQSGLDAWRAKRHALVLLDLQLPRRSGEDVLDRIREIAPEQTVVVLTAHAEPERHEALVFSGAAEFLEKPFDPNTLRKTCHAALRTQKLMDAQARNVSDRRETNRLTKAAVVIEDLLVRGQTQHAFACLRGANRKRARTISDDEWAAIKAEFD